MKKILALVLAVMMLLALTTTAFAANKEGEITVSSSSIQEGKVYDFYQIFKLTGADTTADGVYDNANYSLNTDWVNFFFKAGAAGASYVTEKTEANKAANANKSVVTYDGKQYFINLTTDAEVAAFAQLALPYVVDNSIAPTESHTATAAEATAGSFTQEVDLGYYLMYPKGASKILDGYASICTVTNTLPEAEIVLKAKYPDIDKDVDGQETVDTEIGETKNYTINGEVPDTTGFKKYVYKVSDTMSAGLTFNKDVVVKFGGTTITPSSTELTLEDDGFTVNFDMTKYQTYKGQGIVITYSAVVNEGAVVEQTVNNAVLEYSNNPKDEDDTEENPPIVVPVYSNEIKITKVDEDSAKLSGAEFALMDASGKFYKQTVSEGKITKTEFVTVENATIEAKDGAAISEAALNTLIADTNITKLTSDTDGLATFKGLKDGKYYIIELVAPNGYNRLESSIEVEVEGEDSDEDGVKDIGETAEESVMNKAGAVLPSTGGIGTTIFYAVGGLLVTGVFVLFVTKRRTGAEG